MDLLEQLKQILDSEEGKKAVDEYFQDLYDNENVRTRWMNKIADFIQNNIQDFELLIDKLLEHDGKCSDRLYKKGIDGQSGLMSLMLNVFENLGQEASEEYYTDFVSSAYEFNGYICQLFQGQGSFIRIVKK